MTQQMFAWGVGNPATGIWLYFVTGEKNGVYKVGISRGPTTRRQKLQGGHDEGLSIVRAMYVEDAEGIERTIKTMIRRYGVGTNGGDEWGRIEDIYNRDGLRFWKWTPEQRRAFGVMVRAFRPQGVVYHVWRERPRLFSRRSDAEYTSPPIGSITVITANDSPSLVLAPDDSAWNEMQGGQWVHAETRFKFGAYGRSVDKIRELAKVDTRCADDLWFLISEGYA